MTFATGRSVTSDIGRFRAIYRGSVVAPVEMEWADDEALVLLWWMPTVPVRVRKGDRLTYWASPDGIHLEGVCSP